MKARKWQRYLDEQRRVYGKTIFTVTELANVSGSSPHALNVELSRLVAQRVLVRYAQGRYGLPDDLAPEALLPHLDSGAYITGLYALSRHNLVTQVPTEITCFTDRRHNRSRTRTTAAGRFTFVCVSARIYAPPTESVLAGREQALCDFVFLSRQRGVDPRSLVTLRNLHELDLPALQQLLVRYPATMQRTVAQILPTAMPR